MLTANKLDLYKVHRTEYAARPEPALVYAEPATYLTIEGAGEPGGAEFVSKLAALHAVAFTIKLGSKQIGRDYGVSKLEAQYWSPTGETPLPEVPRARWCWKLLIRTPDFVTDDEVRAAIGLMRQRGKGPEVEDVTLETLDEGLSVQLLYVGPYGTEGQARALDRLMSFTHTHSLEPHSPFHEIYISDPRRVSAAKLRTILRQPVR